MYAKHKLILTAAMLLVFSTVLWAQTTTFTAASGNWSTAANWTNGVPSSTVTAIIQAGSTCTLNVSGAACKALTLSGGTSGAQFTVSGSNTLSVTNAITISAPTSNSITNALNVNAGAVTCGSLSLANPGGSSRVCSINITTGSLAVSGGITLSGASTENVVSVTGAGSFKAGGTLSIASTGSFVLSAGTFEYNGSGNQTIQGLTYYHLTVSTGGTKSLGATATVNGNLTVSSGATINFASRSITVEGSFTNNGTVTETSTGGTNIIKGAFINNGTWGVTINETYEFRGGFTNNGSFTPSSGTYTFSTNNQTIDGTNAITFPNNMNITGAITVTNKNNLTIGVDLVGSVSGSTFLNDVNASVNFGRNVLTTGTLTASASGNTVNYSRAGTQTIAATTYYHLQKNSSGTATLGGTATVNGNLAVNTGTLSLSTFNLTVAGNVSGTGNITMSSGTFYMAGDNTVGGFTPGTGTVEFNKSGDQAISGDYFYNNITVSGSGTKTIDGSFTVANLTLSAGALAIGSNTLTVSGTISGSGTITGSSTSNLSVRSAATLNMTQTSSSTRTLNNLTFNSSGNTLTIGNALEIVGAVTVTAGTVASGGNITLISTASGDASVANSAGSITGNVTVQKYIPAGSSRRWLHMGSPVSGFTWDQLIDDIYITGQATAGFDPNGGSYPSAYTYLESVSGDCGPNGWQYPSNVSNSVTTGKGLKTFFRGDRSNPSRLNFANPPAPNATIIDFTGTINSGTQNLNVTYTNNGNSTWDGWNFVANPYPSAINWNAASGWTKTNISGTIYVWNAQSGVYATWNGSSGTNGMSNGRIAMGQGFWVKATATSPSLIMTEAVKTSSAATGFFKSNYSAPVNALRVSMVQDTLVRDELLFNFGEDFDRAYDKASGDALKLYNTSINIWAKSSDDQDLVISNYPSQINSDTITLGMTSSTGGIYTLEFSTDSLPQNLSVYLIDSYRNRTIDIRKEKSWKVLINAEEASYAVGRLKLVFINNVSSTQLNLAATSSDNKTVNVNWTSNQEMNTQRYEVEHSTDGQNYSTLSVKQIADTLNPTGSSYSIQHQTPVTGINYYRVKRVTTTGAEQYTNTAEVNIEAPVNTGIHKANNSAINVYPNPATTQVNIKLPAEVKGEVKIELFNLKGSSVYVQSLSAQTKGVVMIDMTTWPAGVYVLKVSGDQYLSTQKIQKQ